MKKPVVVILVVVLLGVLAFLRLSGQPLDARATIDSGVKQVKVQRPDLTAQQEAVVRIQLAVADYTATVGTPPTEISQLVPKYFDTVPNDPQTGQPMSLDSPAGTSSGGETVVASAVDPNAPIETGVDGFVNPNTMVSDDFVYDPAGRRDPFQPFDFSGADEVDMSLPPLERYSLGQLKLTATLNMGTELSAVVEDATGRGYTVRKGSRVGNSKGVVTKITENSLFVVETKTDITGKVTRDTVEMKIQRPEGTLGGDATFNRKIMNKAKP